MAAWFELAGKAIHAVLASSEPDKAEGLISVLIMSGVHVVEFPFNDEIFFFRFKMKRLLL